VIRVAAVFKGMALRLAGERGTALVMSLGMSSVLAISGTSAVLYTTSGERAANRSKAEVRAQALAEAGVNYAFATLYNASDPTLASAVPPRTLQMEGGTVEYYGSLDQASNRWTLTGIGRVPSPNPNAGDVIRIIRGRARIGSSTHGSENNAVWNYVYADATTGCTSIGNSVNVNVPLYIRGSLCLSNSASMTGYSLQVGGTLSLSNTSHVGSTVAGASSMDEENPQVHEVHVAGGCRLGTSGPFTSPCGDAQRVYSEAPPDANTTGLTKPPVDLPNWYQNAYPGPMHGCTTGSFPGGFDTDTVMNESRGTVNIAPATAYDCQVRDASNNLIGRIAWDPATKVLTILGTIFIDGSIEFSKLVRRHLRGPRHDLRVRLDHAPQQLEGLWRRCLRRDVGPAHQPAGLCRRDVERLHGLLGRELLHVPGRRVRRQRLRRAEQLDRLGADHRPAALPAELDDQPLRAAGRPDARDAAELGGSGLAGERVRGLELLRLNRRGPRADRTERWS
jgi:hypothetical protein